MKVDQMSLLILLHLCFKTGSAVILRGGSEAFYSNKILIKLI